MNLLSEFRRRNVFRMALLYVVAAWLLLQVAEVLSALLPGLLPDWIGRATVGLLAIGFPIALVLSWFYEVTPEGVSLERSGEASDSITRTTGRRVDFIIIAMLCAAVILFAYDKWWMGPPPERSVAVLPFVNMSAEEDSAHFSDGLADTVLHMLAQVPDLHVPARTSSFQPSLDGLDIGEIGRRLSVSTVLEGSVQLYGDKIRVTAQLIDATDGYHLWSRNFDRDFKDIFAIQDDIAREVVAALKVSMSDETAERLDYGGTDNTDAYTEYLLAIDSMNPFTSKSVEMAIPHVQKAIEIDPNYARAHAVRGLLYFFQFQIGEMGIGQANAAARDTANRALEIAPDLPEALAVLGMAEIFDGNKDTGQQLLLKALKIDPNNLLALQHYAMHLFRELRPDESLAIYRRMIKLNPLDERGYDGVGFILWAQGKMSEALETALRFQEVRPDSPAALRRVALCHFSMGEYAASIRLYKKLLALDPDDTNWLGELGAHYLLVDMVEEARYWFDRENEAEPEGVWSRLDPIFLNYYLQQNEEESFRLARKVLIEEPDLGGVALTFSLIVLTEYGAKLGRNDSVLELLENRYPHLFDDPQHDLNNARWTTYFSALALLQSGDIDRGTVLMKAFLKWSDREDEVFGWTIWAITGRLALGDIDAAMTRLKQFRPTMFHHMYVYQQSMLKHSALFDPIRDEPEFIELLDEFRRNAAEQRRLVQADEAT